MNIGDRIREKRIQAGITQTQLAEYIGTIKQTVYKYEHSIITNIPQDKINLIAHKLNTSSAYLMGYTDYDISNDIIQISYAIANNKQLKDLFSLAQDSASEDLKIVYDILSALKQRKQSN